MVINVGDSLILLNRENDPSPVVGVGRNIDIQGSGTIVVPHGVVMSSAANGPTNWAGTTGGGGGSIAVSGSAVRIRGNPNGPLTGVNQPTRWSPTPVNKVDGRTFHSPFEGKGQPPLGTTRLPNCPVLNGVLPAGALLAPGNYYAVNNQGNPTGANLTLGGNVRFTAAASIDPINYSGGKVTSGVDCVAGVAGTGTTFGRDHILYGGLSIVGHGGTATVEPGRYVLAGTAYGNGNENNVRLLDLGQNGAIVDLISGSSPSVSDPGALFILTNANYPGLSTQLAYIPSLNAIKSTLEFAQVNLQGGTNSTGIRLHGLNSANSVMNAVSDTNSSGAKVSDFGTLAFWQDQGNSYVVHDAAGRAAGSINNPTTRTPTRANSPQFFYQGSANSMLWGTIWGSGSNRAEIYSSVLYAGSTPGIISSRSRTGVEVHLHQ